MSAVATAGRRGRVCRPRGGEWVLQASIDPTFNVFTHVCPQAERATKCLESERRGLAQELDPILPTYSQGSTVPASHRGIPR